MTYLNIWRTQVPTRFLIHILNQDLKIPRDVASPALAHKRKAARDPSTGCCWCLSCIVESTSDMFLIAFFLGIFSSVRLCFSFLCVCCFQIKLQLSIKIAKAFGVRLGVSGWSLHTWQKNQEGPAFGDLNDSSAHISGLHCVARWVTRTPLGECWFPSKTSHYKWSLIPSKTSRIFALKSEPHSLGDKCAFSLRELLYVWMPCLP